MIEASKEITMNPCCFISSEILQEMLAAAYGTLFLEKYACRSQDLETSMSNVLFLNVNLDTFKCFTEHITVFFMKLKMKKKPVKI